MALFSKQLGLALVVSAGLFTAPVFAANVHRSPTAGPSKTSKTAAKKPVSAARSKSAALKHTAATRKPGTRTVIAKRTTLHGQQVIDSDRAMQIQTALIREHYLTGEATGKWDDNTIAAMQKFQADQGWQTKLTPDSRALMKLGLGPDYSGAINAKDSSFAPQANTAPAGTAVSSLPSSQTAGFAAAAGVAQ